MINKCYFSTIYKVDENYITLIIENALKIYILGIILTTCIKERFSKNLTKAIYQLSKACTKVPISEYYSIQIVFLPSYVYMPVQVQVSK